jgi:hypothetical protein
MAKLVPQPGRILFAPLIWRLALKIEQVSWSEVARSASETIYVLRSAQRLFKQDISCASFDTWMEAEAAGVAVERDDLGRVINQPALPADLPPVETLLGADAILHTVDVLSRLARDGGDTIPVATMTAGATLLRRFGPGRLECAQQLMLGLARAYCEAGAGALVLLDEEPSGDFSELPEFAALFNLAEYYATPVVILSRRPVSAAGVAAAGQAGALLLTPDASSIDVVALPPASDSEAGWLAMSRWEVDADTDPNVVQGWRQQMAPA